MLLLCAVVRVVDVVATDGVIGRRSEADDEERRDTASGCVVSLVLVNFFATAIPSFVDDRNARCEQSA